MGEGPFRDGRADPGQIRTRLEFATGLTALRERAGLTVRDVARKTGEQPSTVGGYFAGRHLPPVKPADLLPRILSACGVDDAAEVEGWLTALGRVRRAPGRRPAGAPVPYRGLKTFQPEDAGWFFGRQWLTDVLVRDLRRRADLGGLLAVVGPSGSGKSSLLRAGLIPALRSGALGIPGSSCWPLVLLTPGARPARELAGHLAGGPGGDRMVIVVDQFEEVFTSCQDEDERRAFIAGLCAAAGAGSGPDGACADREGGGAGPAALVVAGLRADFYPHALRYPELVDALRGRQVLVGPMTEEELRSAITGPARKAGLDIEDGLVEVLLRDLAPAADHRRAPSAHDPGALPLLSHALLATWDRSRGGKLTVADYRDSGGIRGAVAASAEEVYAGLTAAQQQLARRIFTRLVHVADDTADTRRRVPQSELALLGDDARPVLDAFVGKRLITAGTGDVEIAHEALLDAWPRLRQWIDGDSMSAGVHRQLTAAAQAWRDSARDPGALYRGGRLAAAEEWAARPAHAGDLNALEREFLGASTGQRLAAETAARRQARRLRGLAGALAALSLVAGALAVVAYQQKNTATYQRDLAISRQVATEADRLRGSDTALAMQLSLAAYRISPTTEATSSLLDATAGPAAARLLGPPGAEMHSVAFNPGGTVLASGSGNGTARLWDVSKQGHPVPLGAPLPAPGPVTSAAFSPDGAVLAVGSAGGTVAMWDVSDPRRPAPLGRLSAGSGALNAVAFSPGGATLAAGSADGRVWLWDVARPRHVSALGAPLDAGTGHVAAVAFSPDGKALAAGGSSGRLRLWRLPRAGSRPAAGAALDGPAGGINAIAFSPDGAVLAAAGRDSRIWLWRMSGGQRAASPLAPLAGARSWIYALAFSPGGTTIAAGSADNNAYIWNLASGALVTTLPHPAPVMSVAYGPGGRTLATGDADDTARIWTLPGPVLTGPEGSVFTVAFSPGGTTLATARATASGHGTVQLWNTADPGEPAPLGPPLTGSGSATLDGTAAYGPGGRLAAGAGNGSIQLWNARDPRHPVRLPAPPTALTTAIQYVAFGAAGHLMAAGGTDGVIELWDSADFARTAPLAVLPADPANPDYRDTFAVAFSPGGRLLAAASATGTVRLWDITDPARPRQLGPPLTRLAAAVYKVAFSPGGRLLAASGADGKVRLWDVAGRGGPRLAATLSEPAGIVYDVAFSPDGRTLAAADGDKTVTLWNITDPARPRKLATLTGPAGAVFSVAFSPGGNALAAGSQDGTTRLWAALPSSAADYVCATAGAPVTPAEWAQYIPELPYNPPC